MTLQELIDQYKTEDYKFFKFIDKNGKDIKTHFIFESHAEYLDKYLGFYQNLPDLTQVIVYATDGIFKLTNQGFDYFIRHNHQEVFKDKDGKIRGVPYEVTKQVRANLIRRINDIMSARNFDEIHQIVEECKIKGFGPLSIYDTSMRIATKMNIEPDKVYLHAGAAKGMEILEEKGYVKKGTAEKKFVKNEELPIEMQKLRASENEHFLCSMKEKISNLDKAL
ncbi:MAG: hypothetical protein KBC43_12855 [Bacteroidales bacterium]|nr:hypothetical protein [Bacteroidales bacterium]